MHHEDHHLEELLTAYLDGRLEAHAARRLESRLESDRGLRDRLEVLKTQRQALAEAFQETVQARQSDPRSDALFERVMAEVRRVPRVDAPQTADHLASDGGRTVVERRRSVQRQVAVVAVAAAAAVVLLAASLWILDRGSEAPSMAGRQGTGPSAAADRPATPIEASQDGQPSDGVGAAEGDEATHSGAQMAADTSGGTATAPDRVQDPSTTQPAEGDARGGQYVSQLDFSQSFVFVVDVEMSAEAVRNDFFRELLQGAGIRVERPIAANEEMKRALAETRMIVQPQAGAETETETSDAWIYFVRADIGQIGPVLDKIYVDRQNFPRVAFDLAIDNPDTRLMQTIARATGQRFAADRPFAAPVSLSPDDLQPSPLRNVRKPQRFVSATRRQRGFSGDGMAAALPGGDMSNVLFIVRPAR